MQDRAEHLALAAAAGRSIWKARGAKKLPCGVLGAERHSWISSPSRAMRAACALQRRLGLLVDHRPDVGREQRRDRRSSAPPWRPPASRSASSAMSSCTNSTRSAEQRWPALWKRGDQHVAHHLLGQRRGIDDHRVLPAGLGDQRHDRPVRGGERAVDGARGLGRAGEGDAGDARIGDQRRADRRRRRPAADAARRPGTPAWCSRRTAARGDQRRLLGRLGDHRIAGGQRRASPGR